MSFGIRPDPAVDSRLGVRAAAAGDGELLLTPEFARDLAADGSQQPEHSDLRVRGFPKSRKATVPTVQPSQHTHSLSGLRGKQGDLVPTGFVFQALAWSTGRTFHVKQPSLRQTDKEESESTRCHRLSTVSRETFQSWPNPSLAPRRQPSEQRPFRRNTDPPGISLRRRLGLDQHLITEAVVYPNPGNGV